MAGTFTLDSLKAEEKALKGAKIGDILASKATVADAKPADAQPQAPPETPSAPEVPPDAPVAAADPTPAPPPEGETPPAAPESQPSGRARDRIEDLVAERNALRQYGEHQARVIEQLLAQKQAPQAPTPAPVAQAPVSDPAPTLESCGFDATKLAQAQAEWLERQVDRRVKAAVDTRSAEQQNATERATFEARVAAFAEKTPDFQIVTSNPALTQLPPLSKGAARLVTRSELGPQLLYYFGKHPDIAARVARMDPEAQLVALGRIEAQLSAPPPAPQKPQQRTQAPPPPTPVSGNGRAGGGSDPTKFRTMQEFVENEKRVAAEKRARRRAQH